MKNCKGNVLVYILLAVALLAALSFAISRDGNDTGTTVMDQSAAKLYAAQLIAHSAAAEAALQQMQQWGTNPIFIIDTKPDTPAIYDDPTNAWRLIYHPQGGGLTIMEETNKHFAFETSFPTSYGWWLHTRANVEWTDTTTRDVIYSAANIHKGICEAVNEKLTGSTAIPLVASSFNFDRHFSPDGAVFSNLLNAECTDCVDTKSLCIGRVTGAGEYYLFYNIIYAN